MDAFGLTPLFLTLLTSSGLLLAPAGSASVRAPQDGVRYVYLIRHGEYDHEDTASSLVGKPLVPLGHEQARLTGERLAGLQLDFSTFVSSQYTRARETADDIGEQIGLTPARDSLLNECTPSSAAPSDAAAEGKSTACDTRLEAAWAKYMQPSADHDAYELLVCHGNVIRWFVSRALGSDGKEWRGMVIGNASITVIAVRSDGSMRLATFSDTGHIPADKQTWLGVGPGWQPMAHDR